MTSFLASITIIVLIAVCVLLAKYNKSDNLFWVLLVSLLMGVAAGAIVSKCTHSNKNKSNFTQVVNPTQILPAASIDFYAMLGEAVAAMPKTASKEIEVPALGSKSYDAPSLFYGEIRGQPHFINPLNKGTPGMPFDTS